MRAGSLIIILSLATLISFGQTIPADPCGTVEQDRINRQNYPNGISIDDMEIAIQRKIEEMERNRSLGRTQAVVVTIPVVVHVIHKGEPIGTGTNISQAQIQAQLEVLNEDFRRKPGTPGFNNNPVGADIEIEFCLSSVDNNGSTMSEPGIHRYRGGKATYTMADAESLKQQTYWNPNLFFNIWTLDFGGINESLLGYAQFPTGSGLPGLGGAGPSGEKTDGVVIQFSSFGAASKGSFPVMQAPYNQGRTLTHETGHWLGLRHIWGDGVCGDDEVGDTPFHQTFNRGCPSNKAACSGGGFEMPQNYMDYTDDACMNIFTLGQKARMRAVMELSPRRKQLITNNLCGTVVAAPPVASFTSNKTLSLRGGTVEFTDLSTNFPTQWQWQFEGGDPSTSNIQNPIVKYSTPGKFKVSLIARNALGASPLLNIDDYIEVSEQGLCDSISNFKDTYTPSVLKMKTVGDYTGYLTGHNSARSAALSELFANPLGYSFVSGALIKFGKVYASAENSSVTITVWNARGVQNAPGSVIEQKTVLLKEIAEDIANNRATDITFDRETPVFSRPFHVGVELTYAGDSIAVESSANGESTSLTSYVESAEGIWQPYSIAYGANIALNIVPIVGMNPSVQVASSKILINPAEEVILTARGASIFQWNASDNSVSNVLGPQLIVRPVVTTVYETSGSGLDLCNATAFTTVFVREGAITGVNELMETDVTLYPNPGRDAFNVRFENAYRGDVQMEVRSTLNQVICSRSESKTQDLFDSRIEMSALPAGVYITTVKVGNNTVYLKWVRN